MSAAGPTSLLLVTGPPASGKTTLARELARELSLPYLSKDAFKETLYDELGSGDELEDALDRAALALLFGIVERQVEAGVSVVAESNFDSEDDAERFRRLRAEHGVRVVQLWCTRPRETLLDRFAERAASGDRHPGHGDEPGDVDEVRERLERGEWDPLDLPGELLRVELGDDPRGDAARVARRVRELLG